MGFVFLSHSVVPYIRNLAYLKTEQMSEISEVLIRVVISKGDKKSIRLSEGPR